MSTKAKGRIDLGDALLAMGKAYRADPVKAVRSQGFINHLHDYLADDLESRLTRWARKRTSVIINSPHCLPRTNIRCCWWMRPTFR